MRLTTTHQFRTGRRRHNGPFVIDPPARPGRRVTVAAALAAALVFIGPAVAHADPTVVLALAASVDEVLTNIRDWIMGLLAILATVFLTIGGVRYVLAAGDPGEVAAAKTAFKSAGIGYALAALAPLVVEILRGFVGA